MSDPTKRVGKLHRMSKAGKQIRIPCRYCGDLTDFSEELIENLLALSAKTIERRGERPIRNDEVAVCPACRHKYADEFNPDTVTITIKAEHAKATDTPGDVWPKEDEQGEIPF